MARFKTLALGFAISTLTSALPAPAPHNTNVKTDLDARDVADRAQAVVNAFRISWNGYYKYAFPNDELKPVTNGFSNSRYAMKPLHF